MLRSKPAVSNTYTHQSRQLSLPLLMASNAPTTVSDVSIKHPKDSQRSIHRTLLALYLCLSVPLFLFLSDSVTPLPFAFTQKRWGTTGDRGDRIFCVHRTGSMYSSKQSCEQMRVSPRTRFVPAMPRERHCCCGRVMKFSCYASIGTATRT